MTSHLVNRDPAKQWEWHECYRDSMKNMYRTTYSDMSMSREVNVKSDFPSGYGGHVPSVKHDILFRNTEFDRTADLRKYDPGRDAFPSFEDQLTGIPTATRFPQGAKKFPSVGVVPHDGTTTMLIAPWGTQTTQVSPLNFRTTPPTMTPRSNRAAQSAAARLLGSQQLEHVANRSIRTGDSLRKTTEFANAVAHQGLMPSETQILAEEVR